MDGSGLRDGLEYELFPEAGHFPCQAYGYFVCARHEILETIFGLHLSSLLDLCECAAEGYTRFHEAIEQATKAEREETLNKVQNPACG